MPLGMEIGLGPDDIALDWDTALPRKGAQQLATFRPMSISAHVYCGQTVAHLSNCWAFVRNGLSARELLDVYLTIVVELG